MTDNLANSIDKLRSLLQRIEYEVVEPWSLIRDLCRDALTVLETLPPAIGDLVERADHVPCTSCGADPGVSPPTGQELPIVRGALDAQAEAEIERGRARVRAQLAEAEVERLRAKYEMPRAPETVDGWTVERSSGHFTLKASVAPERQITISKYGGQFRLYMRDGDLMMSVFEGEVSVALPDLDMMREAIRQAEAWRTKRDQNDRTYLAPGHRIRRVSDGVMPYMLEALDGSFEQRMATMEEAIAKSWSRKDEVKS